jgi:hypothetical protein
MSETNMKQYITITVPNRMKFAKYCLAGGEARRLSVTLKGTYSSIEFNDELMEDTTGYVLINNHNEWLSMLDLVKNYQRMCDSVLDTKTYINRFNKLLLQFDDSGYYELCE